MSRPPIDRAILAHDPISEALHAARVRSAIVLNDTYREPWGIAVPDATELAAVVDARPDDLVAAFHLVEQGIAHVDRNGRSWRLGQGDLFVSFLSIDHVLRGGDLRQPLTPMHQLLASNRRSKRTSATGAPDARVLCGVFLLERGAATALKRWLPPVLHVPAKAKTNSNPLTPLDLARQIRVETVHREPGAQFSIGRLLELLLGEALRSHANTERGAAAALDAARDEVVWQAVSLVKEDPSRAWTVDDLATACAVSPSTLTERFRAAVGRAPIGYLTDWRMVLAADMLEHSAVSVEQIGHTIGYSNQPAFSRAFKRAFATTPSNWRETHLSRRGR